MSGKVYLVGAGPGDPELLTLKALRLLKTADVVLHDDLISPQILALISPGTQIQNVGKRCGRKNISQEEINALLVNYALLDLQVVRLKGGDPLLFGRAGEEIEALRRAKIEVQIVPGITAALGSAAAAQIPLTHRQYSSGLVLVTNHHSDSSSDCDWPAKIAANTTLVAYMPGYDYEETSVRLLKSGVREETPCAIISRATFPDQQVHLTTVEDLPLAPRLAAPTLLVVGEVVRFAKYVSADGLPAWIGTQGTVPSRGVQERAE